MLERERESSKVNQRIYNSNTAVYRIQIKIGTGGVKVKEGL